MADFLPLRIEDHGRVIVRDGVLLCFFIREPHVVAAESVGELHDRYLELVGAQSLRWYRAKDEWKELTPRHRARLRGLLTRATSRNEVRVAVKGGERADEEMVHGFDYWGDEAPAAANTTASFVELRFATEWVAERGLDAFAAAAAELASCVRFSSGYGSLAFHAERRAAEFLDVQAFRHPGMDVHANEYSSRDIGDRVRGAYWLTFVGPVALAELGRSPKALHEALGPGVAVHTVGDGVMIRAGDELRPGDTSRGDGLPLTRRVARALEPITLTKTCAFGFSPDDLVETFAAWQRRHLNESTR
jgi:hypothetical protein